MKAILPNAEQSAPLRAALYMRVSTGRQAESDLSIPDQRRQATAFCAARGWTVAAEFVDAGVSGTTDNRPELQRFLEIATGGGSPFDVVVVHSLSRFMRDAFLQEMHVRRLAKAGVRLVSMTQEVGDDPVGVIEDFFSMLSRPHLKLPKVFVLPDLRLDGPVASLLASMADTRGLTLVTTGQVERPTLESPLDGDAYLKESLRAHHYREFRRLKRRLGDLGRLEHTTARGPEDIRHAIESFLTLEAAGWKGRERTAMAIDRYRAAFAREAVHRLAEQDMCRIHALTLDDRVIASLIVFVEAGVAYTWKTAYDETLASYSPGTLLMIEVTKQHLDDPNITMSDSCAVPDHPVMSRLWSERKPVGTLVIGLLPDADRLARQAASQLHLYRETRNMARILRNRMKSLLGR